MLDEFKAKNHWDVNENPTGGYVNGIGMSINWQDGPLGRGAERKEPNGAFVETVIAAAKQRLEFYQKSKFKCEANEKAIFYLETALMILDSRTKDREKREVEGTHQA